MILYVIINRESISNKTKINLVTARKLLFERLSNEWLESIQNMSKLDVYRSIKPAFGVEKYLKYI